jgi:alkanesulfonate monooxygenase SsuD/methylene tetrahydromethanopterin reductase-like flavin-dependent oxidoreductase (luciferase family)
VNALAADTNEEAQEQFRIVRRSRVSLLFGRDRGFTDEEADLILDSPQGQHVEQMVKYSAVGTPDAVTEYLEGFAKHADADELIVAFQAPTVAQRLRALELTAQAGNLAA